MTYGISLSVATVAAILVAVLVPAVLSSLGFLRTDDHPKRRSLAPFWACLAVTWLLATSELYHVLVPGLPRTLGGGLGVRTGALRVWRAPRQGRRHGAGTRGSGPVPDVGYALRDRPGASPRPDGTPFTSPRAPGATLLNGTVSGA
jgi:hypothetical protein